MATTALQRRLRKRLRSHRASELALQLQLKTTQLPCPNHHRRLFAQARGKNSQLARCCSVHSDHHRSAVLRAAERVAAASAEGRSVCVRALLQQLGKEQPVQKPRKKLLQVKRARSLVSASVQLSVRAPKPQAWPSAISAATSGRRSTTTSWLSSQCPGTLVQNSPGK